MRTLLTTFITLLFSLNMQSQDIEITVKGNKDAGLKERKAPAHGKTTSIYWDEALKRATLFFYNYNESVGVQVLNCGAVQAEGTFNIDSRHVVQCRFNNSASGSYQIILTTSEGIFYVGEVQI